MSETGTTIALLLGLAGALTNILWPLLRGRTAMLVAQVAVSALFGGHYFFMGARTGAWMNAIALVQAVLAIPLGERPGFRIAYLATLPVIATVLWLSWAGPASAFAALGFALVSLGRYQLDVIRFRIFLLAALPAWSAHNLVVGSIPGLIADACALTSGSLALRAALRRRPSPER